MHAKLMRGEGTAACTRVKVIQVYWAAGPCHFSVQLLGLDCLAVKVDDEFAGVAYFAFV
jgi:hypothetical protein